MSSYYDSDDDVAWGPLTLREIKRILKNPHKRKVDRRQTLQATTLAPKDEQILNEMENSVKVGTSLLQDITKKCNITSSSSEYYTPNLTEDEKYGLLYANSADNMPHLENMLKNLSGADLEETQKKFLNLAKNINTEFDLKNIQQTLVECSIFGESLDDENRENSNEMNDSCFVKSVDSTKHSQVFENDIIILSSDDENASFITTQSVSYNEVADNKRSFKKEKKDGFNNNVRLNIDNANKQYLSENIVNIFDKEAQNYPDEESASAVSLLENQLETSTASDKNITVGSEKPRSYEDFSPVHIPEIDLAAFDETEDCLKLNDTLEEIERMLNADDDIRELQHSYDLSYEECSSVHSNSELLPSPVHIISGSFSQNQKSTPRKLQTSSKLCYDFKTEIAIMSSVMKSDKKKNGKIATPGALFRIPKTPVNPKMAVLNNKNIVSPVGIYIKYSPKAPLTTYVKSKQQKKEVGISHILTPQKLVKTSKVNLDVLPPVVYQPAKNKLFTVKEQLLLPPSIDKMVKKSNVVKHEKRIHLATNDKDLIERKLNSEIELTKSSISDSLLDENKQDISVLASRQAFKK